jgi:hypothetical protein
MSALAQQVVGLPTSHQMYQQQGWALVPIPIGTKGPTHRGWNTKEGCLAPDAQLPPGYGIGLCHAYSGTCALDIDGWDKAVTYFKDRGVDLVQLFAAPDAVQIDSGNPGHGKLLYAMPLGMALPSKKVVIDGQTAFELRCGTMNGMTVQDVLPPSKHPSGSTYRWAGNGNWQRLPQLPHELFELWQHLLDKDKERDIPSAPNTTPATWEETVSALQAISPDCSRHVWIEVGMALHATGHPEAFVVWDDWSAQSATKYRVKDMLVQWRSFKDNPQGITPATLFHHAQQSGWKRPPPDIKGLFGPVGATPKEVIGRLDIAYPPPVANLLAWPTVLASRAEEVSRQVGCDPVVPLMAGLAAVSAAADKRIRLRLTDTWTVPPLLWLMTVGAPADKKSPGSRPMFAPLRQLEIEAYPQWEAQMHIWKGLEARYAAQMKAYREWMASPEAGMGNGVPPPVDDLPPEPQSLRLIINDATSQKVVHMAAGRPRGFLVFMDEMNHWLKKINDPRSSGDDRGCWIQGYESSYYVMDRVGSGSITAENLALAMYGNCQPEVFKAAMSAASSDGLIQRFVPVVLNGDCTTIWEHGLPEFMSFGPAYEAMIRQVYALQEQTYDCSPEALAEFRLFSKWYLECRKNDTILRASPIYMTAMGKIEGTCARLALLLHLINSPHQKQLSADTMRQAVTIVKNFMVPSLQYAFMEIVGLKDETGKWVVEHIIQLAGERPTVTLAEIRASGRRLFDGRPAWQVNEELRIVMDELTVTGYVSLFMDYPRSAVWTINPALAEQFKDHRHKVIQAKQQAVEQIRASILQSRGRPGRNADAIGYVPV